MALLSLRLFDELGGFLPAGAFESFRADLHLDYAQASFVLVAAAPGAIAGNAFSIAADHRSRRVITSIGVFGYALSLSGYAVGHTFGILVVSSFLMGMFATAMIDGGELALIDISGGRVSERLAHSYFLATVGDLAGPALLIAVTAIGLSWRAAFGIAAVLMAAFGVWISTLPIPPPHAHPHLGGMRAGLRDALRTREVWFVGCVALLIAPLDESFLAFLIAKLQRIDGLSLGVATLIAMFTIVGTGIGFAAAPRLRAPSLVRAAAQLTIGAALCGLSPWPPVTIAAALGFGFALARGWMAVKLQAIEIRPERRGTVSAVVSTIEFTGFVLPLLAGVVADAHGLTAGLACYVLIAFALFGVALAYARSARAI